jgi:hypothetical protein
MAVSIFVSTRLTRASFRFRWYDWALAIAGVAAAGFDSRTYLLTGAISARERPLSLVVVFMTAVLLYCSAAFYLHAHKKGSISFKLLAISLALWAVLLAIDSVHQPLDGNVWQRRPRCSARSRKCCSASPW